MADVQIDDGIIKILSLEVQDPKAAAVLAEYPQTRWAEITRKALKIGLGYLKGGEQALVDSSLRQVKVERRSEFLYLRLVSLSLTFFELHGLFQQPTKASRERRGLAA